MEYLKFGTKKISSKREMLSCCESLCETLTNIFNEAGNYKNIKLILVTHGGIIKGTPANENEYDIEEPITQKGNNIKVNLFCLGSQRNMMLNSIKNYEPKSEIIDNGTYLALKDVEFLCGGTITKFPELIVFANEIVGFSVSVED